MRAKTVEIRIRTQNHREFRYELIPSPDYTLMFHGEGSATAVFYNKALLNTLALPFLVLDLDLVYTVHRKEEPTSAGPQAASA